jgi:predicted alpha-1,6-mannanase (GH76 family)
MKSLLIRISLAFIFVTVTSDGFGQTAGITSGATYTIKSKFSNKLLDVSNASMDNSANVDCWTDTGSDAQRWIVTHAGNGAYTFTNVASGKLLHTASAPADSVNVDQYTDTGKDDVKWIIKKAGKGSFYVKPSANQAFSLNLHNNGIVDGSNIDLAGSSPTDSQRWIFQKTTSQDGTSAAAIAAKAFTAWYEGYNMESVQGYFWDNAEMMEVVLDAYEVTKEPGYKAMFEAMYKNFIEKNGADWQNNKYNDDIAWMVLVSVRGYLLTGNVVYRDNAKEQFDKMYARAFDYTYGGGMLWYYTKTTKNSCINGPSMVACCYLAQATGDSTYYNKAISLYTWSKLYLFDAATGKLNDNVDLDKKTGRLKISSWSSTYNQGTYLGAATMLYKYTKEASYLSEAQKIAQYIRDEMYKGKVMNNEDNGNDLPGFKGIFARYARMYTIELNQTDLVEWLRLNATVAYNNRNSQNLIQTKWGTRTAEIKPKSAFGCSTAVSLLMNFLPLSNMK